MIHSLSISLLISSAAIYIIDKLILQIMLSLYIHSMEMLDLEVITEMADMIHLVCSQYVHSNLIIPHYLNLYYFHLDSYYFSSYLY